MIVLAFSVVGALLGFAALINDGRSGPNHVTFGLFSLSGLALAIDGTLGGSPFWTALGVSLGTAMAWLWWRNRPKGRRRKQLREFGAKSQARIAELVGRLTPTPDPAPVGGR